MSFVIQEMMTFRGFSKCICIAQNQVLHIYSSIQFTYTYTYALCWKAETLFCQQKPTWSRLPSGLVQLWELSCKEGGVPKNWCLQTAVLEKTTESPLDNKEVKSVNLNGNQSWIGRTDAEGETSVFWSSVENSWLFGKVPDTGKDWGQKIEGIFRKCPLWGHQRMRWLDGITNEMGMKWADFGDGEGQGDLACYSPQSHKESDTTYTYALMHLKSQIS